MNLSGTELLNIRKILPGVHCQCKQFGASVDTVVIGFHGWTGDEHSLVPIANGIKLPNSLWIFPRAPYKAQAIPKGYSWFGELPESREDLLLAVELIRKIIDSARSKFGETIKIYFLGFSQGATLSVAAALMMENRIKRVVSIAGFLNQSKMDRFKISNIRSSKLSFLILHGSNDKMIPVIKSTELKETLKKSGHNVSLVIHEAGHKLPVTYFDQIRIFLDQ